MNDLIYEQQVGLQKHMLKTFLWMFLGVAITAAVAYLFSETSLRYSLLTLVNSGSGLMISLVVLGMQIGIVVFLHRRLMKMSKVTAMFMFVAYAFITGITFSFLPLIYDVGNMFVAFGFTSIIFVALVLIGFTTKIALTKYSSYILVALITLVASSVLGLFLNIPAFDMIICYAGVGLFMIITVYDIQKMKQLYFAAEESQEMTAKFAIYSALELYLDFINIFIYILRIISSRD